MTVPRIREVRCCCDARLLGYLPKQGEGCKQDTRTVKFFAGTGEILPFEVGNLYEATGDEIKMFTAYKSQDYPIEKLRSIAGWIDA